MNDEIKQGCVDETIETLHAALEAFGFTQTGSATCRRTGLYGRRTEGSDERYIGRLFDPDQTTGDVNRWFETNGPNLPE